MKYALTLASSPHTVGFPYNLERPETHPFDSQLGWTDLHDTTPLRRIERQPLLASPFERKPDYVVVRLEGYIADDAFTAHGARMVQLSRVWDNSRNDNSLTTGIVVGGTTLPEGRIFAPGQRQLPDTIPLYSWYSASRRDTLTTTEARFTSGNPFDGAVARPSIPPDYDNPRLLGYVFHPRVRQPAHTKALWRWFSPGRLDNITTSEPAWNFTL